MDEPQRPFYQRAQAAQEAAETRADAAVQQMESDRHAATATRRMTASINPPPDKRPQPVSIQETDALRHERAQLVHALIARNVSAPSIPATAEQLLKYINKGTVENVEERSFEERVMAAAEAIRSHVRQGNLPVGTTTYWVDKAEMLALVALQA